MTWEVCIYCDTKVYILFVIFPYKYYGGHSYGTNFSLAELVVALILFRDTFRDIAWVYEKTYDNYKFVICDSSSSINFRSRHWRHLDAPIHWNDCASICQGMSRFSSHKSHYTNINYWYCFHSNWVNVQRDLLFRFYLAQLQMGLCLASTECRIKGIYFQWYLLQTYLAVFARYE